MKAHHQVLYQTRALRERVVFIENCVSTHYLISLMTLRIGYIFILLEYMELEPPIGLYIPNLKVLYARRCPVCISYGVLATALRGTQLIMMAASIGFTSQ